MKSSGKLKTTTTADESCRSTGQESPVTMTSLPSIGTGCHESISSAAASLVNHSVVLGSSEARQMTVTSGLKWCDAFPQSGPLGSLVRMCLGSSIWGSSKCYLTWRPLVIKRKFLGFRLVQSMPRTSGSVSGLWVGTPTIGDAVGTTGRSEKFKSKTASTLEAAIIWPTPRANDAEKRGQIANDPRNGLPAAVLWPTMTANTAKNTSDGINFQKRAEKKYLDGVIAMSEGSGRLNPAWVEWLMGYPIGWTDLEDSATPSSRKSRKR